MKKIWTMPMATVEEFAANEYVAACHDMNRVYKFICDAPAGNLYYYPTTDGETDGVYTGNGSGSLLGSYTPCDKQHEAPTSDVYYDGFVDYNRNRRHDENEGVIVWLENRPWWQGGRNGHATAQLDMDEWETAKS